MQSAMMIMAWSSTWIMKRIPLHVLHVVTKEEADFYDELFNSVNDGGDAVGGEDESDTTTAPADGGDDTATLADNSPSRDFMLTSAFLVVAGMSFMMSGISLSCLNEDMNTLLKA